MTWFTYTKNSSTTYAPVRRKILFPTLTENLKQGDWVHVNLGSLDIGRLYYYEDGLIKNKIDSDSYLVVYETATAYTPTYSLILGGSSEFDYQKNLWFKSVTAGTAGSELPGSYYIYYHKDNIQYIQLSSGSYISTTPTSGANYIGQETGSFNNSIDQYSTVVQNGASNERIVSLSFLGTAGIWMNNQSSAPGAKAVGIFNGPKLNIYAEKGPDCGKIRIKVIKTSAIGEGQKVIKSNIDIDLYAPVVQENQNIYSLDIISDNTFFVYEEIYGDFSFEIEILNEKNASSSGNRCKIEKYTFSKRYNLSLNDEEVKPDIAFKSVGGLK
jgi:hypothetical protein